LTAVDASDSQASVTHACGVQYGTCGVLPPIDNLPTVNAGTAGRTFAVKWHLADAGCCR
jgi:hypothetical protein